jgi:5-methylcytosine-specific restriction endonuclease McrA
MKINKCIDCGKVTSYYATRCCSCSRKWQAKNDPAYIERWHKHFVVHYGKHGFKKNNKYGKRFVKGQMPTTGSYKKGHKHSPETIIKFRRGRIGIHNSVATEFKPKGTKTVYRKCTHLTTPKYNKWRKHVFKRDDYTCQKCGIRGGYLEAHHIHMWIKYPKERYWIKNGLTLCLKCHRKVHRNLYESKQTTSRTRQDREVC